MEKNRPYRRLSIAILMALIAVATVSAQTADGVIGEDEYNVTRRYDNGRFVLNWSIIDDTLHVGVVAPTKGWIVVAFDPIVVMDNADVIQGYVDADGETHIRDARSIGAYGPFSSDTTRGGTNDIISWGGSQNDSETVLEFSRPLDTGDDHDSTIGARGGNTVVWAYGSDDAFNNRYTRWGQGKLSP